jgi:hypothetical protein
MKTLDYEGLEAVLRPVPDTVLVTLLTETRVDMVAKVDGQPNPYRGRVTKRSLVDGFVNFHYQSRVNARREAEGKEPDFQALPHAFAPAAGDERGPFIRHADGVRIYLPISVKWATQPGYYLDGHAIADSIVAPWLKPRKEGARQGLDAPEVYRNYALTSILEVTVADATYRIEHSVSAASPAA